MANTANNPNSLANLRPAWTPETAPRGRRNAGLSINEWRNELADKPRAEIEAVETDVNAPGAKLVAARELLQAIDGDKDARRDACDYTNGKPKQSVDVNTSGYLSLKTPEERDAARDSIAMRLRALLKPGSG